MVVAIGTEIFGVNTIFAVRSRFASVEEDTVRYCRREYVLSKANVSNDGSKIGISYVSGKLFKKIFIVSHNIFAFA